MPDIAAISSFLTSIKTASDIAQLLKGSDISLEKAEVKLQLADLISALADAKIQMADVRNILLDKEERISELEKILSIKSQIKWEAPYYWLLNDSGEKDGPYCQRCHDDKMKLIRLQSLDSGLWECKACQVTYMDKSYSPNIGIYSSDFDPYA